MNQKLYWRVQITKLFQNAFTIKKKKKKAVEAQVKEIFSSASEFCPIITAMLLQNPTSISYTVLVCVL